ncbi:hypothetical protein K1T71_001193 [Dendrolimus kikuchii]|uniref:Uncharacterized protein n=1 Tax=Dendrolimus kikuchii TaxID=765133 RepID=A0ACC1DIH3_9NEOP|nr:hypothetical protein K1T71_001193 [Dendrolimus kikuchii]
MFHIYKILLLFISTIFVFSETAFVDNLPKCKLADNECMRDLYQSIVRDIGKTGIADLNIPPIDPMKLKNVSVLVANLLNITLVDGVVKGIKDCVFDKFTINITAERGSQENICDVTIKGHYNVISTSPFIQSILGGNTIHGDGNGLVKIEKLHLTFDFPFYAQKRDDGAIYIKCLYKDINYEYNIKGKTHFAADNLYFGDQELSEPILAFLNENEKLIMSSFGEPFMKKAIEFYFQFASYFFDNVPAKYFLIDDLTPYGRP